MKKVLIICILILVAVAFGVAVYSQNSPPPAPISQTPKVEKHWFLLHRKSNEEFLYRGVPGNKTQSELVRTFKVRTGTPGKSPTPLPQLLGREYWIIIDKFDTSEIPETAPFFIQLDVPGGDVEPYGPVPYEECDGQCNWGLPGPFGLHGINGDPTRLNPEGDGSSGCIRHTDEDITFLYNLIKVEDEVRYYIEDI